MKLTFVTTFRDEFYQFRNVFVLSAHLSKSSNTCFFFLFQLSIRIYEFIFVLSSISPQFNWNEMLYLKQGSLQPNLPGDEWTVNSEMKIINSNNWPEKKWFYFRKFVQILVVVIFVFLFLSVTFTSNLCAVLQDFWYFHAYLKIQRNEKILILSHI